jgi:hypothetical protein
VRGVQRDAHLAAINGNRGEWGVRDRTEGN